MRVCRKRNGVLCRWDGSSTTPRRATGPPILTALACFGLVIAPLHLMANGPSHSLHRWDLESAAGLLEISPQGEVYRVELRNEKGGQLVTARRALVRRHGLGKDGWPAEWKHGQAQNCERSGPWLVLSGVVSAEHGDWLSRYAYIAEGHRVRCVRRWQWQGERPARKVTLSVRWQTPHAGASLLLPGICYHGNPSGSLSGAERVASYAGKADDELFLRRASVDDAIRSLGVGGRAANGCAALHTLPSLASHANRADQWWSLGLVGHAIGAPNWLCFPAPVRSTADEAM